MSFNSFKHLICLRFWSRVLVNLVPDTVLFDICASVISEYYSPAVSGPGPACDWEVVLVSAKLISVSFRPRYFLLTCNNIAQFAI